MRPLTLSRSKEIVGSTSLFGACQIMILHKNQLEITGLRFTSTSIIPVTLKLPRIYILDHSTAISTIHEYIYFELIAFFYSMSEIIW